MNQAYVVEPLVTGETAAGGIVGAAGGGGSGLAGPGVGVRSRTGLVVTIRWIDSAQRIAPSATMQTCAEHVPPAWALATFHTSLGAPTAPQRAASTCWLAMRMPLSIAPVMPR